MYQIDLENPVHVHFIGIGGISMSGLALILKSRGFTISGSDREPSATTAELEAAGIPVSCPQSADNITPGIDLVVYTAAIHPDNPEYAAAVSAGLPMLSRAQLLGQIMRLYGCATAISGTHGKTTTTSMLSEILMYAGKDPTLSVGGMLPSIGGNVRVGGPDYFVAEACEYTDSFLEFFPDIALILNVEADHLDYFKDLDAIRHSFARFAKLVPAEGAVVISSDIDSWQALTDGLSCRVYTFGSSPESDYSPEEISVGSNGFPAFIIRKKADGSRQPVTLSVPGMHNIYNAVAAYAAADLLGVPSDQAATALRSYHGTDRRFQIIGQYHGATVVDDYAHHPTEIEATLRAAADYPHERIVCAFQSHTYSRTKALLPQFADALCLADEVLIAPIYAARETDTLGVSGETIAEEVRMRGHSCTSFESVDALEEFLRKNCRKGDLLITMGAGNLDKLAKKLVSSDITAV